MTDQFSVKKADKMGFLENQDGGWMMEHRGCFFFFFFFFFFLIKQEQ